MTIPILVLCHPTCRIQIWLFGCMYVLYACMMSYKYWYIYTPIQACMHYITCTCMQKTCMELHTYHIHACSYMHILGHTCTWIFEILLSHTHTHIKKNIYIYWLNTLKHVKICIWYLPAILSISCITQGCLFGGRSAAWWTDRHATQCHRVQFHGERVRSLKQNWVSAGGCNSWQRCWWWWCWWWWWWWWWWGWGY